MNASVLIVEDSEVVSVHLQKVLNEANYHVTDICISGEDAIASVKREKPEIIIMDVSLNGKYDGIETSALINEDNDIPIIYLTGIYDPSVLKRAKFGFPYSILSKPFSEAEILSNIELGIFKHEADSVIRESKLLLDSILQNIESCLLVFGLEGDIIYINRSLSKILEIGGDEIFKDKIDIKLGFMSPEGEELSFNDLKSELLGKDPDPTIYYLHYKDLHLPINHLYAAEVKFTDNGEKQLMLMFSDAKQELLRQEYEKFKEREYLMALFDGVEQERERVSRELHDGLGQMLKAIQIHARNLFPAGDQFDRIIKMIEDASDETARISNNLMPTRLKDFGLISALDELGNDLKEKGIKVCFRQNLKSLLSSTEEINIYRIVQEAYANILNHSQAKSVFLHLYDENTYISLAIEDDGKGFNLDRVLGREKSSGKGLKNIIQRVKTLAGEVDFDTSEGNGTSVLVRLNRK